MPELAPRSPNLRKRAHSTALLSIVAVAACVLTIALLNSAVSAKPPRSRASAARKAAAADTAAAPATDAGASEVSGPSDVSRIIFSTVPPSHATVTWGKKVLGQITPRQALVVVRPRDSGPLDVVVRAAGCLPVQTRAHTFAAETRVAVRITPVDQKATLLGYRAPLDAGAPVMPDEGDLLQSAPP